MSEGLEMKITRYRQNAGDAEMLADQGGAWVKWEDLPASFIEHSAKEVGPVTGRAWLDFHPADRLPDVPKGQMRACIIMHRSKHTGKNFTMPAYYLNAYPLEFEDGCGDEKCEDEHDDGCPVTGWFYDNANFEYENCYYRIEGECLAWALIPDAVAVGAALEAPPAKEVGAVSDEMVERVTARAKSLERIGATEDAADLRTLLTALESSRTPVVADAGLRSKIVAEIRKFEFGSAVAEYLADAILKIAAPIESAPAAGGAVQITKANAWDELYQRMVGLPNDHILRKQVAAQMDGLVYGLLPKAGDPICKICAGGEPGIPDECTCERRKVP
jgi:hypothetical protein